MAQFTCAPREVKIRHLAILSYSYSEGLSPDIEGTFDAHSLRHVKAVQDFSAGCSTSIRPQIDVPFIK